MKFRDVPIKRKLTTVMMMTTAVALLLTAASFFIYEIVNVRGNLVQTTQTMAQITAAQSMAAVEFEDEKVAEDILSKLKAKSNILRSALYLKDGKLLARYPTNQPVTAFPAVPRTDGYQIKGSSLDIYVPVLLDNDIIGSLYLKWDLAPALKRFRWYGGMVVVVLIGSLALALWVANWMQKLISAPILELAGAARAVTINKNYGVRAAKFGKDELGVLTDSFNHMLLEIHEREAALRENEGKLRKALDTAENYANQARVLNAELEQRVTRRTAELASANKELEAFTYSVSHDLRAPLRHIDAFAQILDEENTANLSPSARKNIGRIRQGVQNMGRLVDDLLNLSRVSRQDVKQEDVRPNELIDDVIAELKPETEGRAIEWRIAPLPMVKGDPGLLRQAFANLISNAVKYTRPRPKAVIEIGHQMAKGLPVIFVRDNGVGFNMKYADKLFGVFQRLHGPEEFEGTGVGLATVRRIIELHGGKIWVEAELDKGANFQFTLPGLPAV